MPRTYRLDAFAAGAKRPCFFPSRPVRTLGIVAARGYTGNFSPPDLNGRHGLRTSVPPTFDLVSRHGTNALYATFKPRPSSCAKHAIDE
jgi:hypothetical protein